MMQGSTRFRCAPLLLLAAAGAARAAAVDRTESAPPASDVRETVARQLVDEIAAEVEELRGLGFETPVAVRVVDDAVARRHMLERLDSFQAGPRFAAVGRAYATLGLLPPGADILELVLQALEEQAGGFYDPESGSFYLLDDMPEPLLPAISAHELTHALEDQHYDLDGRMRAVEADDDRLFALGALHEGSASLLMDVFVTRRVLEGRADSDALAALAAAGDEEAVQRLPAVLLRQLVGPYVLGAEFLARGNPAAVTARGYPVADAARAFEAPPVSSEQILHPEKYWDGGSRDGPGVLARHDAGALLGSGWSLAAEGVLGELTLGVLVGAQTPLQGAGLGGTGERWTNRAAAGWGGDRWELWQRGERAVVLLDTVWDTPADAREFAAALAPGGLRLRVRDDRVAVVAGKLARRRADRLLGRMLAAREPEPG